MLGNASVAIGGGDGARELSQDQGVRWVVSRRNGTNIGNESRSKGAQCHH